MSLIGKGQITITTVENSVANALHLIASQSLSQEYTSDTEVYAPDYTETSLSIIPSLVSGSIGEIAYTINGKSPSEISGIDTIGNNLVISKNIGDIELGVQTSTLVSTYATLESEMQPLLTGSSTVDSTALQALQAYNSAKEELIEDVGDYNLIDNSDGCWTANGILSISGGVIRGESTTTTATPKIENTSVSGVTSEQSQSYKLSFYARANETTTRKVYIREDNDCLSESEISLTSEWQYYSIEMEVGFAFYTSDGETITTSDGATFLAAGTSEDVVVGWESGTTNEYDNTEFIEIKEVQLSLGEISYRPSASFEATLVEESETAVSTAVTDGSISTTEQTELTEIWEEIQRSHLAWLEAAYVCENILNIVATTTYNDTYLQADISMVLTTDVGGAPETCILSPDGIYLTRHNQTTTLVAEMYKGGYIQNNAQYVWYREATTGALTIVGREQSYTVSAVNSSDKTRRYICRTINSKGVSSESNISISLSLKNYEVRINASVSQTPTSSVDSQILTADIYRDGTKLADSELSTIKYQWYKLGEGNVESALTGKTSRTLEISGNDKVGSYTVNIYN